MAKECCEHWLWESAAAKFCHIHRDNGIFNFDHFADDCKRFQTKSFSRVDAHHQNPLLSIQFKPHVHGQDLYGSCFFAL